MLSRFPTALVAFLLYLLSASLLESSFLNPSNVLSIIHSASLICPAVIAMQMLLITGLFDLSIGSVAAAAGVTTGLLLRNDFGVGVALLGGLSVGLIFGAVNGFLVGRLGINSFVATLSTMSIARAFSLGFADGRILSNFPKSFAFIAQSEVAGVPVITPVVIGLTIMLGVLIPRNSAFRWLYATGSNPTAALECGIRVKVYHFGVFLFAGLSAATCGLLQASRSMSSSPLIFQDLPVEAIAACVIGGSGLRGGTGSVFGALTGLLFVTTVRNTIVLFGVPVYWRELFLGGILLGAVVIRARTRD
jgi:ribose transport system permease protein